MRRAQLFGRFSFGVKWVLKINIYNFSMISHIRNLFGHLTTPPLCQKDLRVHYVWINKADRSNVEATTDQGDCGVPQENLDRAFDNARRYPQAKFVIWVDKNPLNHDDKQLLMEHFKEFAPDNVKLRDLREIKSYRNVPFFDSYDPKTIWQRVDHARLVVLQEALSADDEDARAYEIYSDFDPVDISLNHWKLANIMRRHGMVFGANSFDGGHALENAFIGFDRNRGASFLQSNLMPKAVDLLKTEINGFLAIRQSWTQWAKETGHDDYSKELGFPILPKRLYKIPKTPKYKASSTP